MHADFHELSEVAAGRREPGDHLAACADCRAELARIRRVRVALAGLPQYAPPAGSFAVAEARVAAGHDDGWTRPSRLAMAASLLVILAASLLWVGQDRVPASPGTPPEAATAAGLDGLVAENARLESLLARLPRTRATRVGTAFTVDTLEDRLAQVDDRITTVALEPHAPEVAERLWRERVVLMNSLVQVQYANAVAAR